MKKEYIEPGMRLVELKHRNHLLVGSNKSYSIGQFNNRGFGKFDTGDDAVTDDDMEDII